MKDISDSYFNRYRRKLSDLNSIDKEIDQVRQKYDKELSDISDRRMRTSNEISEMRRVITTMIDHGIDPVEAKLRNENNETIWGGSTDPSNWDLNGISISLDQNMTTADLSSSSISLTTVYDPYLTNKSNGY